MSRAELAVSVLLAAGPCLAAQTKGVAGGAPRATAAPMLPGFAVVARAVVPGGVSAVAEAGAGPAAETPDRASAQLERAAVAAQGDLGAVIDNGQPRPVPAEKDLETVHPLHFGPNQIPVGIREVAEKEELLRGMKAKERERWLKSRAVPYVLREGKRRPVDHHHETRAAWQAGIEKVYAYSYVTPAEQKRLDKLTDAQFWAEMLRLGWFYPYDQLGQGPHAAHLLPEDTRGHADDPFRSVAYYVRKAGGYDKTSLPFAEFKWANFFRPRLKTFPRGKKGFDAAVAEALELARDPEAKDLPGYKGPK
jgi:hypothetical protein